jgi:hypothetical protein
MADVKLVVADCDGTLLNSRKVLTPETVDAVRRLRSAGIAFALASARPPMGMRALIQKLDVDIPVAALNGALVVDPVPGFRVRSSVSLSETIAEKVFRHDQLTGRYELEHWVYSGSGWYADEWRSPRTLAEAKNVGFDANLFQGVAKLPSGVSKLSVVTDPDMLSTPGTLERLEQWVNREFRYQAHAARSQEFQLDVTNLDADKGHAVRYLAKYLGLRQAQVAVIGDGEVDTAMFPEAGLSIAMGNAAPDVQQRADHITTSCDDNGFAYAVNTFILGS